MQQNARIAIDQIVRDFRIAGVGMPTVRVSSDIGYLYPVMPGDGGGNNPDTVKVIANFINVQTRLTAPMPNEGSALKVASASGFSAGSLAVVYGATQEGGVSGEVFRITHLSDTGQSLLHCESFPWNENQALNRTYLPPSVVVNVTYRKYYIDTSDPSHPRLVVSENEETSQVLADNVENLQVVYDLITGQKNISTPGNPLFIKKATVRLVVRTNTPDPYWNNGIHSITGTSDHYRRLTLESDIQVRNLR